MNTIILKQKRDHNQQPPKNETCKCKTIMNQTRKRQNERIKQKKEAISYLSTVKEREKDSTYLFS